MKNINQKTLFMLTVALLATVVTATVARAGEDDDEGYGEGRGKPLMPAQVNAKFKQECTGCHIAYAPGLLPAESWRKMMAGLDKHFGSNASLDAQDNKEITDFLVSHASTRWGISSAPLRITETAWFKGKHDSHEISPAVWKNPKVKSPANCGACHTRAAQGDFNEDNIVMPR